jgi:hypothetical protein
MSYLLLYYCSINTSSSERRIRMARPTTKRDLIDAAGKEYDKFMKLLNAMDEKTQRADFCFDVQKAGKEAHWGRDKSIRDVLIHLYEWHQLLLRWVNANQAGDVKPFIPEPYNWRTYGDMNIQFRNNHQNTSYEDAYAMLIKSHKDVMALIDTFSNEELYSKGLLPWTGSSTLGQYCSSATASHYQWAMKKLKLHQKTWL